MHKTTSSSGWMSKAADTSLWSSHTLLNLKGDLWGLSTLSCRCKFDITSSAVSPWFRLNTLRPRLHFQARAHTPATLLHAKLTWAGRIEFFVYEGWFTIYYCQGALSGGRADISNTEIRYGPEQNLDWNSFTGCKSLEMRQVAAHIKKCVLWSDHHYVQRE